MGVQREASLDLMREEVCAGDFVLLHAGFVMTKINKDDALESLRFYAQMIEGADT